MSELNLSSSDIAIANRKFAKTCVEKKRRDRINRCLDELKDLMSQADDKARYQKMEKAEILEMAVNYMRNLLAQGHKFDSMPPPPPGPNENGLQYYTMAFRQCLNDFQNFLCVCPNVQDEFKSQIMGFMTQRYMEVMASAAAAAAAANKNKMESAAAKTTSDSVETSAPAAPSGPSHAHGHLTKKHKLLASRYSPYGTKHSPHKKHHQRVSNEENEQQLNLMTIRSNGNASSNDQMSSSSQISSPTQSSSYLYQQKSKFGGSCSSLDSYSGAMNAQPVSPTLSTTSSSSEHNESNRSQLLVASNASSPVPSACSSPASNKNTANSSSSNASSAVKSQSTASSSADSVTNSPAKFSEADITNMQMAINMAMSMNPNLSQLAALNFANFELYQNALMKVWRPW